MDVNPLINPIGAWGNYRLLNNQSKTTISQGITNSSGVYDDPHLEGLTSLLKDFITTKVTM
jgi:hypothetical protein